MVVQAPAIQRRVKKKSGLDVGTVLQVGGALAAGAAAIPSGGMSLAAVPAVLGTAQTGANLGGLAGRAVSSAEPQQEVGMSQKLAASLKALQTQPEPIRKQYTDPLAQAYFQARAGELGRTA